MSSPTKNSIKETTDSRFVENLSITLIDGFFRVEKVKNHVSYHAKYFAFFAITFINCNGYKMEKSTVFENQPKMSHFFKLQKNMVSSAILKIFKYCYNTQFVITFKKILVQSLL